MVATFHGRCFGSGLSTMDSFRRVRARTGVGGAGLAPLWLASPRPVGDSATNGPGLRPPVLRSRGELPLPRIAGWSAPRPQAVAPCSSGSGNTPAEPSQRSDRPLQAPYARGNRALASAIASDPARRIQAVSKLRQRMHAQSALATRESMRTTWDEVSSQADVFSKRLDMRAHCHSHSLLGPSRLQVSLADGGSG